MALFLLALLAYLVIGAAAGLLGGLLGIGGGSVTVPALLLVFSLLGFPKEHIMHLAIGTSLASMVVNTFSASYFHHKRRAVQWAAVKRMLPGIVVGSFAGVFAARLVSSSILEIFFGLFACAVGLQFARPLKVKPEEHRMPKTIIFSLESASISFVSNILGIGGGMFTLPLLTYYDFNEKKAVGTSAAVSFSISLLGAVGYLVGSEKHALQNLCLGYVYLPAFITIALSSFFFASYGAKLTHNLPGPVIRKIFAGVMIAVGLSMIFC